MVRGKGAVLRSSLSEDVTPESVRDAWSKVTDMKNAERLDSITEATGSLVEVLDSLQNTNSGDNNPEEDKKSDNFTFGYKDLILYALGGEFEKFLFNFPFKIILTIIFLFKLEPLLRIM